MRRPALQSSALPTELIFEEHLTQEMHERCRYVAAELRLIGDTLETIVTQYRISDFDILVLFGSKCAEGKEKQKARVDILHVGVHGKANKRICQATFKGQAVSRNDIPVLAQKKYHPTSDCEPTCMENY